MVPPVCNRQGPTFCTKTGAILHVSTGISARSLIPKVGSLREAISTHLGAAISLPDPTNCNREGAEIPADRLPNGCKMENLVGYERVVPSSSWVKREPIPQTTLFPNYPPTRLEHLQVTSEPESIK